VADPQLSAKAQEKLGLPTGYKIYTPFPFAGMNVQASPPAIADQEFLYIENFLRLGDGKLRTAWDVGPAIYSAPTGNSIVSFFFFTIGASYFVIIFLADGSAVQINTETLAFVVVAGAGTFYNPSNGQLPACAQWGTQYLLISNRNTTNDYWAWDGATLYYAGTAAPNGVLMQSVGGNYNSTPSYTVYGGHGSGIVLLPQVVSGGVVSALITNPGTGYESGDTVQVQFSGGGADTGAILKPYLYSSGVAACNVTNQGSGYTSASVVFSGGGGGSGAAASAIINTGVSSVTMTNGGTGYTFALVSFSGGGGTGAAGVCQLSGGVITGVIIVNGGSGYTSAPTVAFSGTGTSAAGTAVIAGGKITGISVTNPGTGYTSAPTVTISGTGTLATAVALLTPAGVQGVTVTNAGSGYTTAPNVTFTGGGGAGATGVVSLNGTSIVRVNMTAGGQNYATPPTVSFIGGGNGSGATAVAILGGGQVIAVNVTNGGSGYNLNVEVGFTSQAGDSGTGAGATAVFAPTSIAGVIMSSAGKYYTDAPAAQLSTGSNSAASGVISLMPFTVSGSCMETYQERVWIANPYPSVTGTTYPGGNFFVSAAGSFTDFATSDGGDIFINSDGFLQTKYVGIRQSNGYLYFFGDGSISVVSNVQQSGSPPTISFNYQNVDPQSGLSFRDSRQDFGRSILICNETGIYGLYGGSLTKASDKLDDLFTNAIFPPTMGAVEPSAAIATLFNVKHYLNLMTITDPDTGIPRNVMIAWNNKDWVVCSQSVNLKYIGSQKISSKFFAWGTDGVGLYPMFERPSSSLVKRYDTKYYGMDRGILLKELLAFYMHAQDKSAAGAGVNGSVSFVGSGLAVQAHANASVASLTTNQALFQQPSFESAPPYFGIWGTGSGGLTFSLIGARFTTQSPDFILGNIQIGYKDVVAVF
jgi:hypothetical protein